MEPRRILVIAAENAERHIYRVILEDAGYDVTTADSAEAGVGMAQGHRFDAVLVDDRTEGTSTLLQVIGLIELLPRLPVVMVSTGSEKRITHGLAAEIRESLRATSLAYMVKPVGRDDLLHVICRVAAPLPDRRRCSEVIQVTSKCHSKCQRVEPSRLLLTVDK
ncbi:MAG TPA: response regulator [Blastocatellia bacterium]|nr:response regulator [Blastocatellia bacterium]